MHFEPSAFAPKAVIGNVRSANSGTMIAGIANGASLISIVSAHVTEPATNAETDDSNNNVFRMILSFLTADCLTVLPHEGQRPRTARR